MASAVFESGQFSAMSDDERRSAQEQSPERQRQRSTDQEEEEVDVVEACLDFLGAYVTKSLRLKYDKWQKLLHSEESKATLMSWINSPDIPIVVVTLNHYGALVALEALSKEFKSKSCFFIRKNIPMEFNSSSFRDQLIYGDTTTTHSIEELSILVEEVYYPLLSNKQNQGEWTEGLQKDVESKIQVLRDIVSEVRGNLFNKTILPMPITINRLMELRHDIVEQRKLEVCDAKMRNSLESIVNKWCNQINEVLQRNNVQKMQPDVPEARLSPGMEIAFWNNRLENLENIYDQLKLDKCKTVGTVLELINSVYSGSFKTIFNNVIAALCEARDVTLWLTPLQPHVENFYNNQEDFASTGKQYIKPMLHCICLIDAHSKYYNKNARNAELMKMVINMLLEESIRALDPRTLFQGEVEEGLVTIHSVADILDYFKASFNEFRDRLPEYTKYGNEIAWGFQNEAIFGRFELFKARLEKVRSILQSARDYYKLEKIEIGGIKGRYLSKKIESVYNEFVVAYEKWSTIKFNPLDPDLNSADFHSHLADFVANCQCFERKLATIFIQAFDECKTFEEAVKLIQMTGSLLKRPLIDAEIRDKIDSIIKLYEKDIDFIEYQFEKGIDAYKVRGVMGIPKDRNFPPVSGCLMWISSLKQHVSNPVKDIDILDYPLFDGDYGQETMRRSKVLLGQLDTFGECIFEDWYVAVPELVARNVQRKVLIRDDSLRVNFHPELDTLMKEIKQMKTLNVDHLPEDGKLLFERENVLWHLRVKLLQLTEFYNDFHLQANRCEFDLLQNEVSAIDGMLVKCLEEFTWTDFDEDFIEALYAQIKDLFGRIEQIHRNVSGVLRSVCGWGEKPFYERKDKNPKSLWNMDERKEVVRRRKSECLKSKHLLDEAMHKNFQLFFYGRGDTLHNISHQIEKGLPVMDDGGETTPIAAPTPVVVLAVEPKPTEKNVIDWKQIEFVTMSEEQRRLFNEYEKYVDGLVLDAIKDAVVRNLEFLNDDMERRSGEPIMEVKLLLKNSNIAFSPSLENPLDTIGVEGAGVSFIGKIEEIIDDICSMANAIPRTFIPTTTGDRDETCDETKSTSVTTTFKDLLANDEDVLDMKHEIRMNVLKTIKQVKMFVKKFENYKFLWCNDKGSFLDNLMVKSEVSGEEAAGDDVSSDSDVLRKPSLEDFRANVDFYLNLYEEVTKIELQEVFNFWFSLNLRDFKLDLLGAVNEWIDLFKSHLKTRVTEKLNDLESFIENGKLVLELDIAKDDHEKLLLVMEVLAQIKEKRLKFNAIFQPLADIVDLLKLYGEEFDVEVYAKLSDLPEEWLRLKRLALQVKQQIAPIKAYQVEQIGKRISHFDHSMLSYRDCYHQLPFFSVPCEDVYVACDETNLMLTAMEDQLDFLTTSAKLFELAAPDKIRLHVCRKELKLIKQLWDFVFCVESCIDNWKTTPWKQIDVEDMEQECKKFTKEIRMLDKEVRTWHPYIYLESILKNLITSMRAITELQNPAIRDRHWIELMKATKLLDRYKLADLIAFRTNEETTLAELLDLNLHNHEEEVKNIVDKAVKEMNMEKTMNELEVIWSRMEFESENHERTNLKLLRASEELIETLEDNQVQLQNLMASKYVQYFLKEVSEWQLKLANVDQTISTWFEVQRKWTYLENIFIGSEDIRNQLPEDTKRFDDVDSEFKEFLEIIGHNLNVLSVAGVDNLLPRLDVLVKKLVLCEKALNNYLECKRLVYPRFYFVSSVDLLNILSNGNKPNYVCRHLTKLYDSLANLKFLPNTKTAVGMFAKENDEYVQFDSPCPCTGKVEVWLTKITETMRSTLHKLFDKAIHIYEEQPREKWIFNWPAQTALCGTQIWWTTEVNLAFERLEEGYENSLKEYQKKEILQLNNLIYLLLGDLSAGDRQKIMTICTIDVHSRDVVAKMISMKVEHANAFQWQSQLRHRWDEGANDCFGNICDAQFQYDYEYLGNTPRLVITPLTDRCYITLTQSLHLIMGGAPAGPAGTGKTETTKDLGRALGIMVYVFNCSEQMDYKSCGNIYKGLAQTGAWGCFDEFNRISIDVLSVVAVQVKAIQDAIKTKKAKFNFMGETISLVPSVGIFITMNPGYAGRTELPENLKALFRPCAMVVPDFALICEIMLVAEGFQEARVLARKFITLYTLCKELLSNQDHYDWGLRAIKSVLVVAGSLKRSDRQRPEDQVLMRALRDFNIPKIVTNDVPVFMGLIGDLFPSLDVPRKRNQDFEKLVRKSATDLKLQAENNFILKVVQLEELFAVRHSVFIVGNAGTGKTQVWKTLFRTYQNDNKKPFYNDLNPKAVTTDELFGIINPATREWKDGLLSMIMRDQTNMGGTFPKWIILDGDIDPMWIESLNTVMDDNKVLTLASNERIALSKEMRLLFEIGHLKSATPATVSRAGILYINPQDLGWFPYVASWIETRIHQSEKTHLTILFEKYIPHLVTSAPRFKKITPINEITMVQMTCHLLDCLLTPTNAPPDSPKDVYEKYFVFSAVWAFGSALFQDQFIDWRYEFSKWWLGEFKDIDFPEDTSVFNYYIDPGSVSFQKWNKLIPNVEIDLEIPLQAILVPTVETTRLRYFMDLLMKRKHPVMLVGASGSGKSVIVADKLANLSDDYNVSNIPFNFYTTSQILQSVLESPLEKKAGRKFGPPGSKKLIYFIDDINMPEVDPFGTVQPHTIIRQFLDYQHWYDRSKLTLKEIHNCQLISCMSPTSGSFTIDPRLQRHFLVFSVNFPSNDSLIHIYKSILSQHLESLTNKFSNSVQRMSTQVIDAALTLHTRMSQMFLPTAIKFHYIFNLRDLANIFTGILFATHDTCPDTNSLARLYIHEATRVYSDKLINQKDMNSFKKLIREVARKSFEDCDETKMFSEPTIYCHFAESLSDPKYMPVKDWSSLSKLLEQAQVNYNEIVGHLDLVLFEDAMSHVCRISRILEAPRGNALLIGVGGSGKQSLARLAAFISSLSVFQLQLTKDYGILDLRKDLAMLYMKVGVKNVPSMFLMSDAQVPEEDFLILINDILASGEIPELFTDDEIESITASVKNEVKQSGMLDTKQNCWKFFIDKVRHHLKVVLCFSPVGSTLRVRARKFPAIVNCTAIDWFHEWPQSALESVSFKFLSNLDTLSPELTTSVSEFMAYVHGTVNEISKTYFQNEKRFNYTTPKSFLELIALYSKLLTNKTKESELRIARLENGLQKLSECAKQVDSLKAQLAEQEVHLKIKNEAADKLIIVVSAENQTVQREKNLAAQEEVKVRRIEEDVSIKAKLCEEDLRKAEPALIAAQEALNTLNKNNLTELRSFGAPPEAVVSVCAAVMVLFSKGKIPKDRSWKSAKAMMGKVDNFLNDLITYDKEHIHPKVIEALQPYLEDPEFDPENILAKSVAAAGLCAWVINIHKFYEVYQIVEPKQRALKEAQEELQAAQDKLSFLNDKINDLEERLNTIKAEFDAAIAEKQKYQKEADKTAFTIDLANRLVGGLASENVRWRESVSKCRVKIGNLPGDALLISCFICYVGSFTKKYRTELLDKLWIPTFNNITPLIPHTSGMDPLDMICDDAMIATWNNEGLPSDRMSTENATILTNSTRWPLLIDPQLQGIRWIKQKYSNNLVVLRLNQKGYLDVIEDAIREGKILLIENIEENLDAVLDNLLGRALIRRGKFIKIGDKEIDYNTNFQLILQTKLSNPHYKPEMQAQTTLINFTVTRDGLEEQLLAEVVKVERPDLEQQKASLTQQQNSFKINLKLLEDDLLQRLANAGDNVLEDPTLVYNLEKTKKTADSIEVKVVEAKMTSAQIDIARENYRTVAERASILYFILNDLYKINPIYQFSLKAFVVVFLKAIINAPPSNTIALRVKHLIESITYSVFLYTCRGLFEKDKLIFMAQMVIQILLQAGKIKQIELDFLLRYPYIPNIISPYDFLSHISWGGVKALALIEDFRGLDKDFETAIAKWKKFIESETPETEKLPGEWKSKNALQKLCIMRALRPDRMTYAVRTFIEEKLGPRYVEARMMEFSKSYEETSSTTAVFFILSPGVDPLVEVEKLGKKLGYTDEIGNFYNVSLGQGQEKVAEAALDEASKSGSWVILQNVHLVAKWLPALEKKIEAIQEGAHENFRLFISAEPAPSVEYHCIPQGLLESSIKITNEPPAGMQANLHQSLDNFNQETLEMCTKEPEFKAILFTLCYFHAVVAERRKFGPQGWNKKYPFNVGDLTISVYVLYNYLEMNTRVPWEDLRYLFGEIMYGGHITDDWDRRLCKTYLEEFLMPDLVDGELCLCPGFPVPPNTNYEGYHNYIDQHLPSESPYLYGLHPNAEIGFLTNVSENLFKTILELQPRESGTSSNASISKEDSVRMIIEDLTDKVPEEFHIQEMMARIEDRSPFIVVAFQECERMNILIREIKRSLRELHLGLKGELTITPDMEILQDSLFYDRIPDNWERLAYPSLLGLQSWWADLMMRFKELEHWSSDFALPASVWLAGFFNPQSFLTAIMQQTARKNEWPLDRMCLCCEVTQRFREDFTIPPLEGAYINGLFMEGARWDRDENCIGVARLKELFPMMPVMYIKAITQDKKEMKNIYRCPLYKTRIRGQTYVWTFDLRSKEKSSKWTLGGVCLLLQL